MQPIATAFLLVLLATSAAHASWLDDAWSDKSVSETGGPAITLNAELGVILVLPVKTLSAAHKAGLSTKQAATLFLERWGQHCSDILDLDQPHNGVSVTLSLSRPVPLPHRKLMLMGRRVTDLFVTDEQEAHFTIDYVPTRKAKCVTPDIDGPTS